MTIRQRRNPSGKMVWQLDCGLLNGKRVMISFPTRAEAEAEMADRRGMLKARGHQAFAFSEAERVEFMECRARLSEAGANLTEATDFYLKHAAPVASPVSFEKLLARCLEDKEDLGLRPGSVRQLRSVGGAFARHDGHALKPCHEITQDAVRAWLRANEWAEATWNNYLGDLRTIFQWGMEHKLLARNPCDGISRKADPAKERDVEFLQVDQVETLFRRAQRKGRLATGLQRGGGGLYEAVPPDEEDFSDFIPFLVLGTFCGLRPERELGEMGDMSDVHLREKIVIVKGTRAKTRARRVVTLPDNACAWLKAYPKAGGVLPRNFKRRWKRLREQCGLFKAWPHDALRHTYATYHYAEHKDERKLQAEMGHESADMLHRQYRGLGRPAEARRFWGLRPKTKAPRQ